LNSSSNVPKSLFQVDKVTKTDNGNLEIKTKEGKVFPDVDCLLWAVGRNPNTQNLGLQTAGKNLKYGAEVKTT
jgi:glutathione reductase (NADPH)